jgi:hypothetical protein
VPVDRLAEIATSLQEEADTLCAVEDGLDDLIAERDRAFEALGVAAEELRSGRREPRSCGPVAVSARRR